MKISRDWLQTFFKDPLPSAADIGNALTFHAFEIESIENDILDVKVTPNRGHDCLSYRGIARELSAILKLPLIGDSHEKLEIGQQFSLKMPLSVAIHEPTLCSRYIVWSIKGVKVGPSPKWLVDRLASMGQQSINNVVDITNFVMFSIGQPLHAFDAKRLSQKTGAYAISVRKAKQDEKLLALDDKEYVLKDSMLVIADATTDTAIGIAGVKGGKPAGISNDTTDIIIESANFNGVSVRRTAAALKLRTDASQRFEQVISPELTGEAMRMAARYILEIAGGELGSFADEYPQPQETKTVSVSLAKINRVLGTVLSSADAEDALTRLGLPCTKQGDVYTVTPPKERIDIVIPEDLIEEVGRIVGYEKVQAIQLPDIKNEMETSSGFISEEAAREDLMARGYSEVFTSVFVDTGEKAVLNKVDGARPYLRATLIDSLKSAYEKNLHTKDILGLEEVKLFEIGTVWTKGEEKVLVAYVDKKGAQETPLKSAQAALGLAISQTERYQPFSKYPAIVRDIALWVPKDTSADEVLEVIKHHAGSLLIRSAKFDEFAKGDRISYAFRLVFQSFDRTLFDGDANERMESIYMAVKEKGWEVR